MHITVSVLTPKPGVALTAMCFVSRGHLTIDQAEDAMADKVSDSMEDSYLFLVKNDAIRYLHQHFTVVHFRTEITE